MNKDAVSAGVEASIQTEANGLFCTEFLSV